MCCIAIAGCHKGLFLVYSCNSGNNCNCQKFLQCNYTPFLILRQNSKSLTSNNVSLSGDLFPILASSSYSPHHYSSYLKSIQLNREQWSSFTVTVGHYVFYVLQQFDMHRMSGSTYCTITMNLTFTTVLHFPIHAQFENLFTQKPSMFNKFWQTHGTPQNVHEVSFHLWCS